MIRFDSQLVRISYVVADYMFKMDSVIVSAKWPFAPHPRLVWKEDALEFSI